LKSQLDSTLAEVEAITEHLEKQKLSPTTETCAPLNEGAHSLSSSPPFTTPMPTARRKTSGGDSQLQSKQPLPQPRSLPRPLKDEEAQRKQSPNSKEEGKVFLRQSSWASREQVVFQYIFQPTFAEKLLLIF